MFSQDHSAFVPALPARNLLRRPRPLLCHCSGPSQASARRQPARMQSEPENAEVTPAQFPEMTSTKGFALRDAVVYDFAALPDRPARFEVAGAYAVRDDAGQVQYMGYSKNIASKLRFHEGLVPDKCASFQVYVPPVPPELISPEMLENVLEYWVREIGDVPKGNTVDRAMWENPNPVDRKSASGESQRSTENEDPEDGVPIRERSTPRRVASRRESAQYYSPDPFADAFRSSSGASTGRRRKDPNGWTASDDDYVEVDVDPLDPFSASKRRQSTRSSWEPADDEDEVQEDWLPILALMGVAGLIWVMGLLSNALPAATPSLGM